MYRLSLIHHSDIPVNILNEVIRLKSICWPYSYDDQLKWMNEHLKGSDIHVLLSLNERNIAYLNLIEIDLVINGKTVSGLGVGNVCSEIRGNGWGTELMLRTNNILRKYKRTGLLFCRNRLVNFYGMCKWKKIDSSKMKVIFDCNNIVSMYFNYDEPIEMLEFTGSIF